MYCAHRGTSLYMVFGSSLIMIHRSANMRTNIDIDDALMREAIKVTGLNTKKKVVEYALKEVISLKKRRKLAGLRGRLNWEGDLNTMRATE